MWSRICCRAYFYETVSYDNSDLPAVRFEKVLRLCRHDHLE